VIAIRTRRSLYCATSSASCSASSATSASGSIPPTGRCWPHRCTDSPRPALQRLQLLVRPDTILRWHRDLLARRHATVSRPPRRGRPRTLRSIRTLVLRLARENSSWGYRRLRGELLTLGIKIAASTIWEILHEAGIDPTPDRTATTWTDVLRSQAHALLAADFIEAVTPTGTGMYILALIEHASRRIRVLGATAHPTAWVAQAARNLVMDLQEAGSPAQYLIRDRDGKYPALFDAILADSGITIVRSGVQMPRMKRSWDGGYAPAATNCSTEL
jgi:transposase